MIGINVAEAASGIGQAIPLLKEINAQHYRKWHLRSAFTRLGVIRVNQSRKTRPRHHRLHLAKKNLPLRTLLLMRLLKG